MPNNKLYSVVVPIFNEEETIPELNRRLTKVMRSLGSYEVIYVNDGSQDSSERLILGYCQENLSTKLISLSRNFGHQAALSAGLKLLIAT